MASTKAQKDVVFKRPKHENKLFFVAVESGEHRCEQEAQDCRPGKGNSSSYSYFNVIVNKILLIIPIILFPIIPHYQCDDYHK